jgi:hypothetical protein
VYLPNGRRLEAHCGLSDLTDDPRYMIAADIGLGTLPFDGIATANAVGPAFRAENLIHSPVAATPDHLGGGGHRWQVRTAQFQKQRQL